MDESVQQKMFKSRVSVKLKKTVGGIGDRLTVMSSRPASEVVRRWREDGGIFRSYAGYYKGDKYFNDSDGMFLPFSLIESIEFKDGCTEPYGEQDFYDREVMHIV